MPRVLEPGLCALPTYAVGAQRREGFRAPARYKYSANAFGVVSVQFTPNMDGRAELDPAVKHCIDCLVLAVFARGGAVTNVYADHFNCVR